MRRDPSPRNIHVVAAASLRPASAEDLHGISTSWPRFDCGNFRGISTSWPRRRRDPAEDFHGTTRTQVRNLRRLARRAVAALGGDSALSRHDGFCLYARDAATRRTVALRSEHDWRRALRARGAVVDVLVDAPMPDFKPGLTARVEPPRPVRWPSQKASLSTLLRDPSRRENFAPPPRGPSIKDRRRAMADGLAASLSRCSG